MTAVIKGSGGEGFWLPHPFAGEHPPTPGAANRPWPHLKTGVYWLDPKGAILASKRPFQAYCMLLWGGGGAVRGKGSAPALPTYHHHVGAVHLHLSAFAPLTPLGPK